MNINSNQRLFHKAVMESGGPTSRALHYYDSDLHEQQFQQLLSKTGCDRVHKEKVLSCLRAVTSKDIISASQEVFANWNPSVRWAWQPVIDDEIISRRPLDAWNSNHWNKVPILTGFNHNEGTMYVPKDMNTSEEFDDFFSTLLPQLSKADKKRINELYPDPSKNPDSQYVDTRNIPVGSQYKRVEAAYGQYAYACPVRQTAQFASKSRDNPPVYLYHWAVNTTVQGGANHGDQMKYETMEPAIRSYSSTQEQIAGYFHAYITSFISSGNPNTVKDRYADRPEWKSFGSKDQGGGTMVFGEGNDERAGGGRKGTPAQFKRDEWANDECQFWSQQAANWEY